MKNKENKETEKNRTVINNPSPKDVYYEKLKLKRDLIPIIKNLQNTIIKKI